PTDSFQRERYVPRVLEPLIWLLFEASPHDALERRRDLRAAGEFGRVFLQDRAHRVGGRPPLEGACAREHFVENRAQSKDVRALIYCLSARLLGRHVAESPHDDAGCCRLGRGGEASLLRRRTLWGGELRQAEVENLQPVVG